MNKEELLKIINKEVVSEEELILLRKYYRDNYIGGCSGNDWFGGTGVDGIYYTYEYIFNYHPSKSIKDTYKFLSEFQLT